MKAALPPAEERRVAAGEGVSLRVLAWPAPDGDPVVFVAGWVSEVVWVTGVSR